VLLVATARRDGNQRSSTSPEPRSGRPRRAARHGRGRRAGVLLEPIMRREQHLHRGHARTPVLVRSITGHTAPRRWVITGGPLRWARRARPAVGCPASAAGRARVRPGSVASGGWPRWVHYRTLGLCGRPSPAVGHAGPRRARRRRVPKDDPVVPSPHPPRPPARGQARSAEPIGTDPREVHPQAHPANPATAPDDHASPRARSSGRAGHPRRPRQDRARIAPIRQHPPYGRQVRSRYR
jgi:hypothetical protein